MRRLLPGVGAAALLLLVAGGTGCGDDKVKNIHGLAAVEPAIVDFGRVALGSTATREVLVRNLGRAPLSVRDFQIEGLGVDIEVAIRGNRSTIPGGETATLALMYTPAEEAVLERTLSLEVDDPDQPKISVPVTGIAMRPRVTLEPEALDFGRIEIGVSEVRTVTLRNEFDMPVDVQLGQRGDTQFSFEPAGQATVPPLGTMEIPVTFLPDRTGQALGDLSVLPCETCTELLLPMVGVGLDRALVVTPPVIDFEYVRLDGTAVREFTITNAGSYPLTVNGMEYVGGSPAFGVAAPEPTTLEEGEQITVAVSFQPTKMGPDQNTLRISSSSVRSPETDVIVKGIGGGPELRAVPVDLDFGRVPFGSKPHLYVRITNVGADPTAPPLEICQDDLHPLEGPFGFYPEDLALPHNDNYPGEPADGCVEIDNDGGDYFDLRVWYQPTEASMTATDFGSVGLTSNDGLAGVNGMVTITAKGSASEPPPCSGIEFTPTSLDFGTLDVGYGAVLSFTIRNTGATACILRDLDIAPGSDPAFRTDRIDSFTMLPNGWFGWFVSFDPHRVGAGAGSYAGELEVYTANGAAVRYALPLSAKSENGCLQPQPRFLDFGNDPAGCGTKNDVVTFTNVCAAAVDVTAIELGEQTAPDEFGITGAPGVPLTVGPGEAFEVGVEWNAQTRGINSAPLYVTEVGRGGPLMVPLLAELNREGTVSDRFIAHKPGTADVLVVVDNSVTMAEEQARVAASIGALYDAAAARNVDFHIAVTTTGFDAPAPGTTCPGGVNGAEAGRFFPVDESRPRIITPATPNGRQTLIQNTQVGTCQQVEQGMEAMRRALSAPLVTGSNAGFLRAEAPLSVLFISEDDDASGFSVATYADFLRTLKGQGGGVAHAIVDTTGQCSAASGVADRYLELVNGTGGTTGLICAANWAGTFNAIADQAFTPRTEFELSQVPDAVAGIQVLVNGVLSPDSAWDYIAANNSIRFVTQPAPKSEITVSYTAACE